MYREKSDGRTDKVRPANTEKLSTNISTKFARRRSRQSSPCKCNATIDKVQRNYRLNSPCKCNAIDNARPSDSATVNAALITQSQNSKLFRRQTLPFRNPKTTNPLKFKRENSKENIYTPKLRLLHYLTKKLTLLSDNAKNTSAPFKN